MVLSRPFHCPTQVYSGTDAADSVGDLTSGRRWALATSAGWSRRGAVDRLIASAGRPAAVIDAVPENPKVSDIFALYGELPEIEVLIALGGGSVIDCAKALVAFQALAGDRDLLMSHLRDGAPLPSGLSPAPIIAIPTTSGTGSEVTRWATIWGDEKVKFSLTDPALYPAQAVLDPRLCVSMPPAVTLASGLDALSHAMEAIWNRNHTMVSDIVAMSAIRALQAKLPQVVAAPDNVELRSQVQLAALMAGYAMGTTQTALAHSISYPFTAGFGMPHGFACSFTLAEVARYNAVENPDRVRLVAEAFGSAAEALPDAISDWLDDLGIGGHLENYVTLAVIDDLGDNLINRARAANNVRDVDGAVARSIAHRSLERFCGGGASRAARSAN